MSRFNKLIASTSPRRHALPSQRKTLLYRLSIVTLALLGLRFLYLHHEYRYALAAKYTSTVFDSAITDELLRRTVAGQTERQRLLEARSEWRPLGSGFEGTIYAWDDQVIKTYRSANSPFRNCMPALPAEVQAWLAINSSAAVDRWPTEIPTSLDVGEHEGFVPVSDFFLAATTPGGIPQWHVVSPLAAGGDLRALAKRVRDSDGSEDVRALDKRFRPHFEEALRALQSMHDRGLCHDDIKPSNIFVSGSTSDVDDGTWLLGDFGNVRQIAHSYHSSRIWLKDNAQLRDCRSNDARRAMRTYLQFLQAANAPDSNLNAQAAFAQRLFAAQDQWARLFWRAYDAGNTATVRRILEWSQNEENTDKAAHYVSSLARKPAGGWSSLATWLVSGKGAVYRSAVNEVLLIALSESRARKMGLTKLLGLPVRDCTTGD